MATEPSTSRSKRSSSSDLDDEPKRNKKRNHLEDSEEAITKEEIEGTEPPAIGNKPRNACKIYMYTPSNTIYIHLSS